MIRITATGNNFGAGDIIFTAFGNGNLLILNAEVTFDPSNPAYRAVSGLEIYVRTCLSGGARYPECLCSAPLTERRTARQ